MDNLKDKKFVMVTDRGLASRGYEPAEAMQVLLYAFLNVWSDKMFEVDCVKAAERIIDVLFDMQPDDDEDLLDMLFGEDDESNG